MSLFLTLPYEGINLILIPFRTVGITSGQKGIGIRQFQAFYVIRKDD